MIGADWTGVLSKSLTASGDDPVAEAFLAVGVGECSMDFCATGVGFEGEGTCSFVLGNIGIEDKNGTFVEVFCDSSGAEEGGSETEVLTIGYFVGDTAGDLGGGGAVGHATGDLEIEGGKGAGVAAGDLNAGAAGGIGATAGGGDATAVGGGGTGDLGGAEVCSIGDFGGAVVGATGDLGVGVAVWGLGTEGSGEGGAVTTAGGGDTTGGGAGLTEVGCGRGGGDVRGAGGRVIGAAGAAAGGGGRDTTGDGAGLAIAGRGWGGGGARGADGCAIGAAGSGTGAGPAARNMKGNRNRDGRVCWLAIVYKTTTKLNDKMSGTCFYI